MFRDRWFCRNSTEMIPADGSFRTKVSCCKCRIESGMMHKSHLKRICRLDNWGNVWLPADFCFTHYKVLKSDLI